MFRALAIVASLVGGERLFTSLVQLLTHHQSMLSFIE